MLAKTLLAASLLGSVPFLGSAPGPAPVPELPTSVDEAVAAGLAQRLGTPSRGHGNIVSHVAYSSDGKRALSTGWDWAIRIWDGATGDEEKVIEGHEALVYWAWFCDGDKRVVSSSSDKTIRLWGTNSGKQKVEVTVAEELQVGAVSPDGSMLAAGTPVSDVIYLYDLTDKCKEVGQLKNEGGGMLVTLAFSPDGTQLASGGMFSSFVQIHDVASREVVLKEKPPFSPSTIAWAPDGKSLYLAGSDELAQFGIEEKAVVDQMGGHDETSHGMSVSADGKVIYFGDGGGAVRGWNLAEGTQVFYAGEHRDQVTHTALSPDGKTLMSGSHDATVRFWDVETSKETLVPVGHTGLVQALAWSADGARLGSGGYDNSACLWGMAEPKLEQYLVGHEYSVVDVVFVSDDLFSAGYDSVIHVWGRDGAKKRSMPSEEIHGTMTAFAAAETQALVGFDGGALVPLDLATGEWGLPFDGHKYSVSDVDWSPDGKFVATTGWDGVMRIFNPDGAVIFADKTPHAEGLEMVDFLSSDVVLVADGSATLQARSAADGKPLWSVPMGEEGWIGCLAGAPDGKTFAMFCSEGLTFRDAATGATIFSVNTPDSIGSMAFTPDGKRLATGLLDSTIVVWDLEQLRLAK